MTRLHVWEFAGPRRDCWRPATAEDVSEADIERMARALAVGLDEDLCGQHSEFARAAVEALFNQEGES